MERNNLGTVSPQPSDPHDASFLQEIIISYPDPRGSFPTTVHRGCCDRGTEIQDAFEVHELGVLSPQSNDAGRSGLVHFVRIGNRALNLDRVSYCEVQVWHDTVSVKVFMSGTANNTPVVLNEEEAKQFWKYIEYIAEKPV